jgi:hypothetical protein
MNNPLFHLCALLIMGFSLVAVGLACRQLFGAYGIPRRVAGLRRSGVLPAEGGSDADILRLANENRRYEAALLHVTLYGSKLPDAKRIVGDGGHNQVQLFCVLTEVFCTLLFLYAETRNLMLAIVFGACAVVFFSQYLTEKARIARARKELSRGILPTGNAAARR